MAEQRKSVTEDRDMLERYLVWRALDRQQRRQRRIRRAGVVAARVAVIGAAAVGWSAYGAHLAASLDGTSRALPSLRRRVRRRPRRRRSRARPRLPCQRRPRSVGQRVPTCRL